MSMKFYATQYRLPDPCNSEKRVLYNSSIYAPSYGIACKLALKRGIGEFVVGVVENTDESYNPCPLPSELYQSRKMLDALHTIMFYSWIGDSADVINTNGMLSDVGLMHEVMHELHHPQFYGFRQEIFDRIVAFEKLIPGLTTYDLPEDCREPITAPTRKRKRVTVK